jgi:hypothetical protein
MKPLLEAGLQFVDVFSDRCIADKLLAFILASDSALYGF